MIKKEATLYNGESTYIISPDEGKELVRTSDGTVFQGEIMLGYLFSKTGKHKEVPEDFTEQDIAEETDESNSVEEQIPEITTYLDETKYKELTEQYIRDKYSVSDELAVMRQKDDKPDEFKEYYDYCEACKVKAKEEATYTIG